MKVVRKHLLFLEMLKSCAYKYSYVKKLLPKN
jgi:hypothetical protein